jgi:hypothetical protein
MTEQNRGSGSEAHSPIPANQATPRRSSHICGCETLSKARVAFAVSSRRSTQGVEQVLLGRKAAAPRRWWGLRLV